MPTLRARFAIQFAASNGATAVNFALSIALARILSPAEIGIFSITAVTVGFAHVFRDFGVASFIRRQKELSPAILRAAMGVLVTSSWTIAAVLYLLSDYVAAYFQQPGIQRVMPVLALGFVFIPFGAIPQAVLGREMQAEKQAVVTLVSTIVYAGTSIGLALLGYSYMCMAWANLANILVSGICLTLLRPKGMPWIPSLHGWGNVVNFGFGAILVNGIKAIDTALADMLLGKLSGPHDVGIFSRANSTVNIVSHISGPTINYFALPFLARIHHENAGLVGATQRGALMLTGIVWPALIATAALSREIIEVLYGQAWLECAPVVPILCLALAIQSYGSLLHQSMVGIGKPYITAIPLALGLASKLIFALMFFDRSLTTIAWAFVGGEIACLPVLVLLVARNVGGSPAQWLSFLWPSVGVALAVSSGPLIASQVLASTNGPATHIMLVGGLMLLIWPAPLYLFGHPLADEITRLRRQVIDRLKPGKKPLGLHEDISPELRPADNRPHPALGIAVYGTIAKPPDIASRDQRQRRRLKRQLFGIRDQLVWAFGSTRWLDYRNYESPETSNVGDIAISEATRSLFANQARGALFFSSNWGHLDQFRGQGKALDLIVFAGGGYFLFGRDGRLPLRIANDLACLAELHTPAVLFGVGVNCPAMTRFDAEGTMLQGQDADTVRHLLDRMALISVRDEQSQRFLARFTDKTVHVIGDPALFLTSPSAVQNPGRSSTDGSKSMVGVNFSFHGPTSNEILKRNFPAYLHVLKTLQRETGCRFRYFVHYDTEHRVARLLKRRGLDIEVVSGHPHQLAAAYLDLDLHIGGMLHSCVLAYGAGIPCLGVAYDIKHRGFFALMGAEQYCFSAMDFSTSEFLKCARQLLANSTSLRHNILLRRAELESSTEGFVRACLALCRDSSNNHSSTSESSGNK